MNRNADLKQLMGLLVLGAILSSAGLAQSDFHGPRILVTGLSAERVEELSRAVPEAELVSASGDDVAREVALADALIGTCDRAAIRAGKKLRWVQAGTAGVEQCMFPELVKSDIVLTNVKILQGPEIADHAMALLLTLTRNTNIAVLNREKERWGAEDYNPIELRGKTALVIGVGGVGTQVAERAAAFGMSILAVDPKDIPYMDSVEQVVKPDQLPRVLPEADVVFMCAPHTPKTEGMLGAEEFLLMKPGAYFINVSRGKTVQTDALVEALKSGHLAGAGLDVTDPEPLPKDHPLWDLSNVVLTPHVAWSSDQVWDRLMALFKENIRRFVEGLPLYNVVDKNKGY